MSEPSDDLVSSSSTAVDGVNELPATWLSLRTAARGHLQLAPPSARDRHYRLVADDRPAAAWLHRPLAVDALASLFPSTHIVRLESTSQGYEAWMIGLHILSIVVSIETGCN